MPLTLQARGYNDVVALATSVNITVGGSAHSRIGGFLMEPQTSARTPRIKAMVFHVPNIQPIGIASLVTGDWKIQLVELAAARELWQPGVVGSAMTATGRLERNDGASFTPASGREVIRSLGEYLSFMSGAWVEPILLTGESATGAVVWRERSVERLTIKESRFAAFPMESVNAGPRGQAVLDGFIGWRRVTADPYWDSVLQRSTYYLIDANRGPADLSTMTAQSALETLGWAVLVIDRATVSKRDFPLLRADEVVRKLLIELRQPVAIPAGLGVLAAFAPPAPVIADGPGVLNWLRNKIAHPMKTPPSYPRGLVSEAWRLAVWYFESTVLARIGYSGPVRCRIDGDVRPFP